MVIATTPAYFFLESQLNPETLLHTSKWQIVLMALLFFGASNIAALGLIIFLAGLKNLPLLTNAKARKGMWVKLAGANLLIVCFGAVAVYESGIVRESWLESWIAWLALALFVFLARTGVVLFRRGWKYDAIPADEMLQQDPRRPVVYVRSFKEDPKIILDTGRASWRSHLMYTVAISAEQELAFIMERVGPVVAIGKPGEPVPELGASRLYARDDEWRVVITDLMNRARLVVIRAGTTANLQWEIDQAVQLLPRRQLIFVSFGSGKDTKAFDEDIEQRFGKPETVGYPPKRTLIRWLVRLMIHQNERGKIIYFNKDSRPYVEPIQSAPGWSEYVLSWIRPYWGPLAGTFRRVFKQLELPWVDHKNKTIAVLLALSFGIFGLHHFYLGNKRRGLYHLVFFWTAVPYFLGMIDAVKIMRADKQNFERNFVKHHQPEERISGSSEERGRVLQ